MSVPLSPPLFDIPNDDLPLLKLLRTAARNPLEMWPQRYYREKIIVRNVLGKPNIVFNDPEAIRHVLTEQRQAYEKQTITRRILLPQAGYGVFLSEGERWKRQRRILSPAFTPRNIEKLMPHFVSAIRHWQKGIDDTHPLNLANEVQCLTLKVAAKSIFSVDIDDARERLIISMFSHYAFTLGAPNFFDVIARTDDAFPFATRKRQAFKKRWFGMIEDFIKERAASLKAERERDVCDLLEEARDSETGEALTHEEIVEEIATLTAAGFDTTSRSLFWTFYLLALAPQWQEMLRAEVNSIPDLLDMPSMEKIDLLVKTKAVWQEAMRLYPPGSVLTRQAMQAHNIMGLNVPKGAMVVIAPWLLHRHHAYWDEPGVFKPERFYEKNVAKGIYIPFGTGPRVCLGAMFATVEAMLMIAAVVKRWHITLVDQKPVTPVMLTATMPSYEPSFLLTKLG